LTNGKKVVILDPELSLNLIASSNLKTPLYKIHMLSLLLFADVVVVPEYAYDNMYEEYKGLIELRKLSLNQIIPLLQTWKYELDRVDNFTLGLLRYANKSNSYFFTCNDAEKIEKLIEISRTYLPSYLPMLKESLLIQDILNFIISDKIVPYMVQIKSDIITKLTKIIAEFKRDFQEGILELAKALKGQYFLNQENKTWIKQFITQKEIKLLNVLTPENLRKFKWPTSQDIISLVISTTPIASHPILNILSLSVGAFIEAARYLRARGVLKDKGVAFVLSIMVIKKLMESFLAELEPVNCVVCALSKKEIEQMSEREAEDVIRESFLPGRLCVDHMVAYLDIRKKYKYTGKKLLLMMKCYY